MTKVEIIQKALEDKKATNIEVLDVAEQTSLADYFVVASCQSTVQVSDPEHESYAEPPVQ